jgi:peptidoglycan/xylan/chitin deacetylase (PgdA/CDA1 family)
VQIAPSEKSASPVQFLSKPRGKAFRWIVFSVVLIAVVIGVAYFINSNSEPAYQGVTLGKWIERYNNEVDAEEQTKEAAEAVRHIGSNAVPTLLRWLQASDSKLKIKLTELCEKQSLIKFSFTDAFEYNSRALFAFEVLGSEGKSAIPRLQQMVQKKPLYREIALHALCRIGPEAFSTLISDLTNADVDVRENTSDIIVESFASPGPHDPAVDLNLSPPLLCKLLQDSNDSIRLAAIVVLGQGNQTQPLTPDIVVPLLIRELNRRDPVDIAYTALALKRYGAAAKAAVPLLVGHAKDTNETGRVLIIDALEGIDPAAATTASLIDFEFSEGGITRGPKDEKRIALVFTAHTFAEGGDKILDELAKHNAKGSFFVTGVFLDNPNFQPLARRIVKEGHYLGPHSDKHLLYCPWDGPKKTLVRREEFEADLNRNLEKISRLGVQRSKIKYWLPAYEWYNRDIVDWSKSMGLTLVNYTPGTRSNADYLEDTAKNFISSRAILDSIEKKEQTDPHGLNGFLLLTHLGVGPGRTDKLSDHFGELLDYLADKGYQFVRVDELLESK